MLTRREILSTPFALWQAGRERLNIILILVDDWGATDLACYGSRFYETPNIDRFAKEGMRFTQAYSACTVCSPSRAAVLTGKYPARLHLTDFIQGKNYPWARLRPPEWTMYLPLSERTTAEALNPLGYQSAAIGKWHLTPVPDDQTYFPEKQGFENIDIRGFRGYFSPSGEYLTDRETSEAVRFIETNRQNPFFLYLPYHAVHDPIQAKEAVIERYRGRIRPGDPQKDPAYAAMVYSLDEGIGRLMSSLERTGLARRTVVILTSDNGGYIERDNTANLGLRSGKGSAYEGGVRVPLMVRWPGVVKPGSVCEVPVVGADLYPTVLEIAAAKPEAGQVIDGVSLVPLLRRAGTRGNWQRDALFWHYPHYHTGGAAPYGAIRAGDWKLIEFQEDGHAELYNLQQDPEEKRDLAQELPERTKELRKRLHAWRQDVGAQPALPNRNYDPARAAEMVQPMWVQRRNGVKTIIEPR